MDFCHKQEKAVDALVTGMSVTDAAETVGVNRSTIHRWMVMSWVSSGFGLSAGAVTIGHLGTSPVDVWGRCYDRSYVAAPS